MLPGNSDIPHHQSYLRSSYQIDDVVIPHSTPDTVPLHTIINTVINSPEKKVDNTTFFSSDSKEDISNKSSLLKKLLLGATILAGTGLLATGGLFCYMAGRSSNTALLNSAHLSDSVMFTNIDKGLLSGIASHPTHYAEPVVDTGVSRSPYSYYEEREKLRNRSMPQTSVTTLGPVSDNPSENSRATHLHDTMRDIYYNTLPVDMYRPLGRQLHISLSNYCKSKIYPLVHKASQASTEDKCNYLSKVVEGIFYYKNIDLVLRDVNSHKDILSPTEHADEIIIRRMLTTGYLAAEYIIDNKDVSGFYNDAMSDHKIYSSEDLVNREENIMNYLSAHKNKC